MQWKWNVTTLLVFRLFQSLQPEITQENNKLQFHGSIKLLKFSCLRTRNSLKLYLDQLGSAAYRCWRLTYLNWERDKRERIAYQNGVFKKKKKKKRIEEEISTALKRFFS